MSQVPVKKDPFIVRLLTGIFLGIPVGVAQGLLGIAAGSNNPVLRNLFLLGVISTSVLCVGGMGYVVMFAGRLFQDDILAPDWRIGAAVSFFYGVYIIAGMPVFLLVAHFSRESNLFKPESKRMEPEPGKMWRNRFKADHRKVYIGESFTRRKPLYLTDAQRLMHCEVVGSTGTGKTDSLLLPMFTHDVTHGKGAIIIDGKGDLELFNRIQYVIEKKQRKDDFFFFSLSHPGKSNSYNPLFRGNPTELKDKLINSMAWSEEFYRRMAERAALTLFNAMASRKYKKIARFRDLYAYLTDVKALSKLNDEMQNPELQDDIGKMVRDFKDNQKFLSGLMADLYLTSRSEFSERLDTVRPEIDLLRAYQKNQICYFALDLQKYADTSRRLGRMIIQDIRAVSSYIQAHIPEHRRHFFPVFIDDASSFLDLNFIEFLSKCRASGFAVTMLHQSLGDLVFRGVSNFQQQVMENTNIKIILRQDDPQSVEKLTKIGGTRRTIIPTYQTEEKIIGKGFTGTGSIREGQTFRIEPDLIRELKRGEAVIICKYPSLLTDHIKLDYFGHTHWMGTFKPNHPCDLDGDDEREQEPEIQGDKNGGSEPSGETNPLKIIKEIRQIRKGPA